MEELNLTYSRPQSFLIVIIAYAVATGIGIYFSSHLSDYHPLITVGIADIIATIVIFIFSYRFKNSSLYDPYWSVIPILIAGYFMLVNPEGNLVRQVIILLLVSFWGVRLTFNWIRGWPGLHHQDWRYVDLAKKTGKIYWLVSFSGIHFFPTVLVFGACIPVYFAMKSTVPFGTIDLIATLVVLAAVLIELIADNQLRKYVLTPKEQKENLLNTGLWAFSRHPNYFGEVSFWIGLFLFVVHMPAYNVYWMGAGALAMVLLFVFISIPMMDERHLAKRPEYKKYMETVSGLLPWFPKK